MEQIFANCLMNRDAHTRYVKLFHVCLTCGGDHPGTGRSGVSTIPRLWTGLENGLDSGLDHGLTDLWALINGFQQFTTPITALPVTFVFDTGCAIIMLLIISMISTS